MGRFRHERIISWKPVGDFEPLPIEMIRRRHEQRRLILQTLNDARDEIQGEIAAAFKAESSVDHIVLKRNYDLRGRVFDEKRVSTIIRQWVWETYRGGLGFGLYRYIYGQSCIRLMLW